ncbi:MAG: hypothetical protein AB7H66_04200 [Hyphomonadaceae bacterium]
MRKLLLGVALLGLAACGTTSGTASNPVPPPIGPGDPGPGNTPPPIPLDGPIMYSCSNGQQIVVDIDGANARVQIVGGPSMVLPQASDGYYSNGRYGFRGGGASGQWEVGRAAPATCSGS